MTDLKTVLEALESAEYALDRAILFKHPHSSQREVETKALEQVKAAIAALDQAMMPVDVDVLKRDYKTDRTGMSYEQVDGWNNCIDHLAATNRLNTGWRDISSAPRDGSYIILHRSKQKRGTSRKTDIIMGRFSKHCWVTSTCHYQTDEGLPTGCPYHNRQQVMARNNQHSCE